jgi:hypothetical protein
VTDKVICVRDPDHYGLRIAPAKSDLDSHMTLKVIVTTAEIDSVLHGVRRGILRVKHADEAKEDYNVKSVRSAASHWLTPDRYQICKVGRHSRAPNNFLSKGYLVMAACLHHPETSG